MTKPCPAWSTMAASLTKQPFVKYLLLFFFTVLQICKAQASEQDSLWKLWNTGNEKERLDAVFELYWLDVLPSDPDSLHYYMHEMYVLADQVGTASQLGSVLIYYAQNLADQGEFLRADSTFRESERVIRKIDDPELSMRLYAWWSDLVFDQGDLDRCEKILGDALSLLPQVDNYDLKASVLTTRGNLYMNHGDMASAAETFTEVLKLAESLGDSSTMGDMLSNLGACNGVTGDMETARQYFRRAAQVFTSSGHLDNLPRPLLNISTTYLGIDVDSARFYADSAIAVTRIIGDIRLQAMIYGSYGEIERYLGNLDLALEYEHRGVELARQIGQATYLSGLITSYGLTLFYMGRYEDARAQGEEALAISLANKDLEGQSRATELLVSCYKALGNFERAFTMLESLRSIRDSIESDENQRELIRQQYTYEFEKQTLADSLTYAADITLQKEEVRRQKVVRNGFMGGFVLVGLFALVFFFQRNRIGKEKKRSEDLLHNILPEEVASELKEKGHSEAQLFEMVTVLFTDFKGFTAMSEQLSPKALVRDLHDCFSAFDRIIEKYGIEKIKTIGDAYMAAGGLPTPSPNHVKNVVLAALEMAEFIQHGKQHKLEKDLPYFEIRIGIHTGPVVAGIVGVKKFQYDIWGDTVNTASRMESSGDVGKVNISEATYELIRENPEFEFISRGKIEAKGKGQMEMFYVTRKVT